MPAARAGRGLARRCITWSVLTVLATATLLIATARPAMAHATVLATTPTADEVLTSAPEVTAIAIVGDGTATTPVPMGPVDQNGRFRATVDFPNPGTWTIRFTAVTPAATLEVVEELAAPTTTATASELPTTTGSSPPTQSTREDEASDDDSIGWGGMLAALFLVAVVVACAVGFYRSARRLRDDR